MNRETLLTPEQLSEHLQVTVRRLSHWRGRGEGPLFLKMPGGVIRYSMADVERWEQSVREGRPIDSRSVHPAFMPQASQDNLVRRRRFGGYKTKVAGRREEAARQAQPMLTRAVAPRGD